MKLRKKFALLLTVLMMASMLLGCAAETVEIQEHSVPLLSTPEQEAAPAEEPEGEPEAETISAPAAPAVAEATEEPAPVQEVAPTAEPEPEVTEAPTAEPEPEVTEAPTAEPEPEVTEAPTAEPEPEITEAPTAEPEPEVTEAPTAEPEPEVTEAPAADPISNLGEDSLAPVTTTTEPTETPSLEDHKDDYTEGVWLHVINGGFQDSGSQKYKDQLGNNSIWVEFDEGTRKLPTDLPTATRPNGVFEGWYTTSGVEEMKSFTDENGETYSTYYTTKMPSGKKINSGDEVPNDVQVLYAVFKNKNDEQEQHEVDESARRVTFYLDYNGINNMWGHCLTSIRSYKSEDKGHKLTGGDLLIAPVNWNGREFSTKDPTQAELTQYWKDNQFDFDWRYSSVDHKPGKYTFKGWAKNPKATEPDVWPGDVIKDGESIYAVWEKGDESNQTFDRYNKNTGPVRQMRLEGMTGNHNTGTMTWTTHAGEESSLQFGLVTTPAGATFQTMTWTVSDGKNTAKAIYTAATEGEKAKTAIEDDKLTNIKLELSDNGRTLTVKYTGQEKSNHPAVTLTVNVSATNDQEALDAAAKRETDDVVKAELKTLMTVKNMGLPATAVFNHSWGQQGEPTVKNDSKIATYSAAQPSADECGSYTVTKYKCSVCGEEKTETSAPVEHVYDSRASEGKGYKVVKQPTCTEPGQKQLLCLRCGAPKKLYKTVNGVRQEAGDDLAPIPATGHTYGSYEVTKQPTCAATGSKIAVCKICGQQYGNPVSVPATGQHTWETKNVDVNCQNTILHQTCKVCGRTQTLYQKSNNPNAHTFNSYTTPMNCSQSKLTQYCIYCNKHVVTTVDGGDGKTHVWGDWKVETPPEINKAGLESRTCNLCHTKQTRSIAALTQPSVTQPQPNKDLEAEVVTPTPAPTATPAPKPTEAPEPTATPKPAEAPEREVSEAQKAPADNGGAVASGYAANSAAPAVASADAPVASVPAANASSADAPAANASSAGASKADTAKKLSAPKNIKASLSGTSVKISWGKVTGAEKYQIFYKTGSGGWKKLTTTKSTSYTWKNAKAGTKYSFTVRCVSADGKTYTSDYDTKGVSVTTKKLATPKVSKVAKVSGGIKITWKKITGAEKYQVFYKTDSGGWKKLAVTKSTSYTWKNAKAGTYKFTVRCVSADGKTYTSSYDTKGVSFTYKK